jgi:predicted NUDIX family NTP pyrophosphohydrolase
MKQSAGTLLYREGAGGLEVLVVQPSGFAARYGWSIPKGLPDAGESLEAAARRETLEEAGVAAPAALELLGAIEYKKSRKRVHCFTGRAAADAAPSVASWEVAQARFVPVAEAKALLHPDQRVFVEMLVERLGMGVAKTP